MLELNPLKKTSYVVAVSGGVDSVALLDLLVKQSGLNLIVAHFDHGIRPDSNKDEQLVASLASSYQLAYETKQGRLGSSASEAEARQARYDFLFEVQKKYGAESLVTAHHGDDVVETMIINLLRGSGWRGLCSLASSRRIIRPLLAMPKKDIIDYAKKHNLQWREDSTNQNTKYLRNQVRREVMPLIETAQWQELYNAQLQLAEQIEDEASAKSYSKRRYDYIMWPPNVALEVLRGQLALTRPQAKKLLAAIKTAKHGTRLIIGLTRITFTREEFVVE